MLVMSEREEYVPVKRKRKVLVIPPAGIDPAPP